MPTVTRPQKSKGDFIYDHFQDVIDKYPAEVFKLLMPEEYD